MLRPVRRTPVTQFHECETGDRPCHRKFAIEIGGLGSRTWNVQLNGRLADPAPPQGVAPTTKPKKERPSENDWKVFWPTQLRQI